MTKLSFKGTPKQIGDEILKRHHGNKSQALNFVDVLIGYLSSDVAIWSDVKGYITLYNVNVTERQDKRPIKDIFPGAVAIIDYAFTLNGVDYYQFSDFNNMSSDRGFNCLAFYDELRMRCTPEYLKVFSQALDDIVNNNKGINITNVVMLNQQLKERLEMLTVPDIAYKLCSVVFFDASENPNRFDYKKAIEKAEQFKTMEMPDFFLQAPIVKLLPHLNFSAKDLREYLELVSRINSKHIKDISTMLSDKSKRLESFNKLVLQSKLALESESAKT